MNALQHLQFKSGVKPDGIFGRNTFKAASEYLGLPPRRAVHFFAQCGHETGGFKRFEENLNYSEKGLLDTFSKYFNEESAGDYEREPESIANRVYANRMGNGDEQSGDGFKFRGRGALMLTGRNNYQLFSAYVNKSELLQDPSPVANQLAFESAMYFFEKNNLWELCDMGFDIVAPLTRAINGGYNGLDHRQELTYKYSHYV